jgi:prevent-host-death family protein
VQSVDFGIGKYDDGIMTMIGKLGMKKMAAGSFKIHCLAVMDEVQAKRETVVITKHGKPVAKLVPADKNTDDIYNFLVGKGAIAGDIVSPAISDKEWGTQVIPLDTHVVVWLAFDQSQLSRNAKAAINDARQNGDGLAISDITLLELTTLSRKARIRLDISLESFLHEVEARFIVLPISGRACVRALALPATYPNDPADRIIGATAIVEGMSLLTADREIRRSRALRTIW